MEDSRKEEKRVINGYFFESNQEYIKAKREKQVVEQMKKTVDWKNPETAYKLYRKILDKNSFTTIIGIHFLWELRAVILRSGMEVSAEELFVPVKGMGIGSFLGEGEEKEVLVQKRKEKYLEEKLEKYGIALQSCQNSNKLKNMIIGFLLFIIVGLFAISWATPYTVFTDYENKIINQYEEWEKELEAREAAVTERENALK